MDTSIDHLELYKHSNNSMLVDDSRSLTLEPPRHDTKSQLRPPLKLDLDDGDTRQSIEYFDTFETSRKDVDKLLKIVRRDESKCWFLKQIANAFGHAQIIGVS